MARENVLDDGEAEAGAVLGPALGRVDPVEPLGQPRQVLAGDAGAGVGDAQRQIALLGRVVRRQQRQMRGAESASRSSVMPK